MLLRTLFKLRNEIKSFTARRIKSKACIKHVSDRTVCRLLNKSNFRYLHSNKKGLLAKKRYESTCTISNKDNQISTRRFLEGTLMGLGSHTKQIHLEKLVQLLQWDGKYPLKALPQLQKVKRKETVESKQIF